MNIDGLDYNTQREKLRLMAYGRDVQQMVERCTALPTKAERQRCAASIIETMRRITTSQLDNKERNAVLWYHLALMSNFQLDIDYPVDIVREDKMARKPDKIAYTDKRTLRAKHYGRLLSATFEQLATMPAGTERDILAQKTASQMYRCLKAWGMGAADKEKIASDMAKYTDGKIQLDPRNLNLDYSAGNGKDLAFSNTGNDMFNNQGKKKKKKKK